MRTNLELRAFWETHRVKLDGDLRNFKMQEQTQEAGLNSEIDAVKHAQERLEAAQRKLEWAREARAAVETEITVVEETLEALREIGQEPECRGCGIPQRIEPTVVRRSDNEFRCNDCARKVGVK